jgi:RNA polymerase-binding transcription factor DksA
VVAKKTAAKSAVAAKKAAVKARGIAAKASGAKVAGSKVLAPKAAATKATVPVAAKSKTAAASKTKGNVAGAGAASKSTVSSAAKRAGAKNAAAAERNGATAAKNGSKAGSSKASPPKAKSSKASKAVAAAPESPEDQRHHDRQELLRQVLAKRAAEAVARQKAVALARELAKRPIPAPTVGHGSGKKTAPSHNSSSAASNGEAKIRVVSRKAALGGPLLKSQESSEAKRSRAHALTPEQVARLKQILLHERERILADASHLDSALHDNGEGVAKSYGAHIAESASINSVMDVAQAQSQVELSMLSDIEAALRRFAGGEYGKCEECAGNIGYNRLSAKPFARYCIACRESRERNGS